MPAQNLTDNYTFNTAERINERRMKDDNMPKTWHINIDMSGFLPHKVTPKQLANHKAERAAVLHVVEVLTKINKLLSKNELELYQSEGDYDSGYTPSIQINGYSTSIDNETGLFMLPSIPNEWDENTIVQAQIPCANVDAVYSLLPLNNPCG